jgi:tRNA dimethylallyltransferase
VPHRLFGEWDGAEPCSAADWAARAKREIEDAHLAGQLPILVGGTGLYIRTLLDGIAPVPPIDPVVRADIRAMKVEAAFEALRGEDPERAAVLSPADSARIARALEVIRSTGKPLAHWQEQRKLAPAEAGGGIGGAVDLHPLVLLPPRKWLFERCDTRFARMMEAGAVEEVEALLARGLSPALPVMRAIGVPDIAAMLRGEISRDEALMRGQQATRQYAKRQYTWFRRQPPQDWFRCEAERCNVAVYFERLFVF